VSRILALVAAIAAAAATAAIRPAAAASATDLQIVSLSNRADLVSGADVLLEVAFPSGMDPELLRVSVDGRDVTAAFAVRTNGRFLGLVDDLAIGDNTVTVAHPSGSAELVVTNHPIGGPVFSGQQVQPWECTTERNGLGPALDEQCNAESTRVWRYRTTEGAFANYDVDDPPSDVATTTNSLGEEVPYVFVVETGTANRGIHRFAMLADPTVEIQPWNPPRGWNGSVYYKFGASCGTAYSQADPIENVEDHRALSVGYAVATSSVSVLGSNCNTVTSSETLMMVKELIIERFGPIRHTRGKGGSGGSIGQYSTATGYPGLLQGLNTDLTFEDFWTTAKEVADCRLLLNYFTNTSPHLWPNPTQQGEVTGHATIGTCLVWETTFATLFDPTTGCAGGDNYHATDNPGGCRGTVQDMQVNILGRRLPKDWTDAEKAAGHGFAPLPYDNTGQLYGLEALRSGIITPEQFVDLNEQIGGLDLDNHFTAGRSAVDPDIIETLHRAGQVSSGQTLKDVAIIDIRAFTGNAEFHTNFHSFALRDRLVDAQGHHENQSIWYLYEVPNLPSIAGPESFAEMTAWLDAIDADTSGDPLDVKIVRNRPDTAGDSCILQDQRTDDINDCPAATHFADPLIASGGPTSNDVLKCTLRALPEVWPADGTFGPVPFTPTAGPAAGQWDRLRAAFPDGVCDWSVPGVGQVPVVAWTTYADGPGGQPLGPPPTSRVMATPGSSDAPLPATGGGLALAGLVLLAARQLRRRSS